MGEEFTFGAWLRQRRKALDLTQTGLAERVGCSVEMVRKLEAGTARPSQHLTAALIARLEVPPADQPALVQWARGGAPLRPADGLALSLSADPPAVGSAPPLPT